MNPRIRSAFLAFSLPLLASIGIAADTPSAGAAGKAAGLSIEAGKAASFLGVFTHTEPAASLSEKLASMQVVLRDNPHLAGITLKIQWNQLHPARNRLDWDGFEALVAEAAKAGKRVNIAIIPGGASPDWVFEAGAQKAGPFELSRRSVFVPVPWDPRFIELFLADLKSLAARYAEDPRIFQVEVLAHNYNPSGEEMHAPPAEAMRPFGWSEETVLANWKFWIDRYAELFPKKQLSLVVSQMYRGAGAGLPRQVAAYFVEKCAGHAVLQTHQLQGRQELQPESAQICQEFSAVAPTCHELVGSLKEQPDRQGTPEMTLYNARRSGNLLYLQLWRRDCSEPKYARAILDAWATYGHLSVADMKARLLAEGRFREISTWQPASPAKPSAPAGPGPAQR